jgi:hypothetical protein
MTVSSFPAFVDDGGNFALDNRAQFREAIKRFAGHEVLVTVKKKPIGQGLQSMRYYRGVVIPDIALACGHIEPDEWESVHDGLAWKFLRLPDGPFGEPRRRHTKKSDMSQQEMTAYIDQVILWAETSIPGCVVRRPGDVDMDTVTDQEWE